jgi:hypothetical protein
MGSACTILTLAFFFEKRKNPTVHLHGGASENPAPASQSSSPAGRGILSDIHKYFLHHVNSPVFIAFRQNRVALTCPF